MKQTSLIIILAYLFVLGCATNKKNFYTYIEGKYPDTTTQKVLIKVDSFFIPNAVFDSTDAAFWQVAQVGDTAYSFLCNRHTERFEVYNLDNPRLVWSLPYKSILDENELHMQIWGMHFHNLDTVFIFEDQHILGLNKNGIFYSKQINQLAAKQKFVPYRLFSYNMNSIWDNQKQGFWIQGHCGTCNKDKNPETYFKAPIEVFIPIDSSINWDTLQATYPPRYQSDRNHGWLHKAHRAIAPNQHVYSFSAESDVYIYDLKNRTYTAKAARSKYDTSQFVCMNDLPKSKQNSDGRLEHFILSPNYTQIIYDPYREMFYRFFHIKQEAQKEDGTYNEIDDQEIVLMVFDKDFKLLTEWKWPHNRYNYLSASVGKKGLYLLHRGPQPYSFNYEQKISIVNFIVE